MRRSAKPFARSTPAKTDQRGCLGCDCNARSICRQNVSILFSDVRGFTTISEALGARETVISEYTKNQLTNGHLTHRPEIDRLQVKG